MTDENELQRVLAVVNHIQQLLRRERADCPFCGQHVEALQQVVASVYTCRVLEHCPTQSPATSSPPMRRAVCSW